MSNQDQGSRFGEAREIFVQVMELPVSDRTAFLEGSCRGNPELLEEVRSLLKEAESPESPFEDLVDATYWPALSSLSHEAGDLERLFDEVPEDPAEDPLIGRTVSGFEIIESIGRGGMGMVYRALDQKLDRIVALKLLPPGMNTDRDAKDRFVHEARAASGLQHPNIATVHEIGETEDGQMFIAMGYYPGETLKDVIARGPIPWETALDYATQLATGLKKAHEQGVVHRDIKPGNIMITEDGTVVLLDFGLAKLSHESGYTQVGQWVGTLGYMSPEQARGAA